MNFYENLKRICDSKGLKITPTVLKCGGTKGILGGWQKGALPNSDIIIKLSEYLDVSADYLLGLNQGSSQKPLTVSQQKLLNEFDKLNTENQIRVSERIKTLLEIQVNNKSDALDNGSNAVDISPTITIRHSIYKVSAGKGCDLDDNDQWNTIEVVDTPKSRSADFCLTIEGNSMEPIYHNGDNVLVKSQQAVDVGQIGIFIIEHSGYIKKYGGDRLISLNEKYQDIMFSDYNLDDVRCIGLVIGRM